LRLRASAQLADSLEPILCSCSSMLAISGQITVNATSTGLAAGEVIITAR
jgi:hypothetical protein